MHKKCFLNLKLLLALLISALAPLLAHAQIQNAGFETVRDRAATLPLHWNFKAVPGVQFFVDKKVRKSGSNAFYVKATDNRPAGSFSPFSQTVKFTVPALTRVKVTAWIKTEGVTEAGGLWCQVRNDSNQMIGFRNLAQESGDVKGTTEWKQYALNLIISPDCSKLILGGYLQGTGTVWYDDFAVEEIKPGSLEPPAKEAAAYIKAVQDLVKKNSIYTDSLDWKTMEAEIALLGAGTKTHADAEIISTFILSKLRAAGDNHSFIMSAQQSKSHAGSNLDGRQPTSRLLNNHTGYVLVPGISSISKEVVQQFATQLQDSIKALDGAHNITGWVVDLRENTGGNMYPMIAGLGPLLGEGTAGYFINAKGKTISWDYHRGRVKSDGETGATVRQFYTLKNANPRIAVLIGSRTASSGEMTAISFIGKPNVKLFGQLSGGYTTGNGMYKLPGGATLLLASTYTADRNKNKFAGPITPDVRVPEEEAVAAAQKWLEE